MTVQHWPFSVLLWRFHRRTNNNWAYASRETSLLLIGAVLSTRIRHIDDWKNRTDYFPGEESTSRISEVSMADQGKNASDAVTVDYDCVVCFDDTRTCIGKSRHCNMFLNCCVFKSLLAECQLTDLRHYHTGRGHSAMLFGPHLLLNVLRSIGRYVFAIYIYLYMYVYMYIQIHMCGSICM